MKRKTKEYKLFTGYGNHYFYVNRKGELWGGGKNDNHQVLPSNDPKGIFKPKKIPFPKNERVQKVTIGVGHSVFLTEKMKSYSCGRNEDGRCSCGTFNATIEEKTLCVFEKSFRLSDVSCSFSNTYFISKHGAVFSCGANRSGQLGLNLPSEAEINAARPIPNLEAIKAVEGGFSFAFFLARSMNVYSVGHNQYGSICQGDYEDRKVPVQVMFFKREKIKVSSISSSSHTIYFLSDDNSLYAGGNNGFNEFGVPGKRDEHYPVPIKCHENVQTVVAGGDSWAIFQKKSGTVYGIGLCYCESLRRTRSNNSPIEIKIDGISPCDFGIGQIVCGRDAYFFISADGRKVYGAGESYSGELLGEKPSRGTAEKVTLLTDSINLDSKERMNDKEKGERLRFMTTKLEILVVLNYIH